MKALVNSAEILYKKNICILILIDHDVLWCSSGLTGINP